MVFSLKDDPVWRSDHETLLHPNGFDAQSAQSKWQANLPGYPLLYLNFLGQYFEKYKL